MAEEAVEQTKVVVDAHAEFMQVDTSSYPGSPAEKVQAIISANG